MTKHNPHVAGPWCALVEAQNSVTIRTATGSREIASVLDPDVDVLTDELRATGSLIEHAPDLYDLAYWIVNGDKRRSHGENLTSIQRRAREILRRIMKRQP